MTRVISITDDIYNALAGRKNGRSFTQVIRDLLERTRPRSLLDLVGSWEGDDAEAIFTEIMEERHREEPDRVEF